MTPHLRRSVLLPAALALVGALAPAPPEPAADVKAMGRGQVAIARHALDDLYRLYTAGEVSISDRAFLVWGQRLVRSLRASGAEKAEAVAALEEHLDRTKKLEESAQALYRKGEASRIDVHEAQYGRLEAAIWLAEEKDR